MNNAAIADVTIAPMTNQPNWSMLEIVCFDASIWHSTNRMRSSISSNLECKSSTDDHTVTTLSSKE
jgi:hypothetical protein